jgi:hypothetical protein
LGEIYLIGLTSKEECAVAALDDGNFATYEEIVHRTFIGPALLLKLVNGEAICAASSGPVMMTPSGLIHCAYT